MSANTAFILYCEVHIHVLSALRLANWNSLALYGFLCLAACQVRGGGLLSPGALTLRGQNCLYGYLNLPTLGLLALEPRDLPPTPLTPYISASECMGTQTDQHSLGESQLGGGCMTLSWSLMPPPETREDRTKRLFRHYTVGSYDSLTSHRYWRGLDTQGH